MEPQGLKAAALAVMNATDAQLPRALSALHTALSAADVEVSRVYKERGKEDGRKASQLVADAGGRFALQAGTARLRALRNPEGAERETRDRTRELARRQAGDRDPVTRAWGRETLVWINGPGAE